MRGYSPQAVINGWEARSRRLTFVMPLPKDACGCTGKTHAEPVDVKSCPLLVKTCQRVSIWSLYPSYILPICSVYLFEILSPCPFPPLREFLRGPHCFAESISRGRRKELYNPLAACQRNGRTAAGVTTIVIDRFIW